MMLIISISGFVSGYDVTTSGISNQQAATNRLTVSVHLIFKNRLDDTKSFEEQMCGVFEFSATRSLKSRQKWRCDH